MMKNSALPRILCSSAFLFLIPNAALAHPGAHHVDSFIGGLLHPLSGLDHILAMVAVGIWAAQRGGKALFFWPAAFVGVMLTGGVMGMQGGGLPAIEPMIAASILILGLLIATATVLPVSAGTAIIALFALFHGNAHGLESPIGGTALLYAAGFALATAALHAGGIGLGLLSRRAMLPNLLRAGGAVTAGIGGVLLFV